MSLVIREKVATLVVWDTTRVVGESNPKKRFFQEISIFFSIDENRRDKNGVWKPLVFQTSRLSINLVSKPLVYLLTSSLSLGVPVPRSTQCIRDV
jgi:hypothetical protein